MRFVLAVCLLATACSPNRGEKSSSKWTESRPGQSRYAYLEERDLKDTFLFSLQTLQVKNLPTSLIEFNFPTTAVSLALSEGQLAVISDQNELLLQFPVQLIEGQGYEVDFQLANNLLQVEGGIPAAAGRYGPSVSWQSAEAPKVIQIVQNPDLLLVDFQYDLEAKDLKGQVTKGQMTYRMHLSRQASYKFSPSPYTVGDGLAQKLGFFGKTLLSADAEPLRMFDMDRHPTLQVYLKDFPADYFEIAKSGILSWNEAFGRNWIEVLAADASIDLGDPRYTVVKWLPEADATVPWAGTANASMTDPISGRVLAGGILVNGGAQFDILRKGFQITTEIFESLEVKLGKASLQQGETEAPFRPDYILDPSLDFEKALQAIYRQTIAHEMGHVLGLKHNFKGSFAAENGYTNSIMDYLALRENIEAPAGIGAYDKEAIRWAYFGEATSKKFDYCGDLDQPKQWNCIAGDSGNPLEYFPKLINQTVQFVTTSPSAKIQEFTYGALSGAFSGAFKMKYLKDQLTADQNTSLALVIDPAIQAVCTAKPSSSLSIEDQAIVQTNIDLMKARITAQLSGRFARFLQPWLGVFEKDMQNCLKKN